MDVDFSFWLTLATLVVFVLWLLDRLLLSRVSARRFERARQLNAYAGSFFPVLLIVLVARSFLFEPFQIPSASMVPTLVAGDFILVNKFAYGLRLPVTRTRVLNLGLPERGEVAVFTPPHDSRYFIKRIIGLPGDKISYRRQQLRVNGRPVFLKQIPQASDSTSLVFEETLGKKTYRTRIDRRRGSREGEWVVPEGHYFVLGDNRNLSEDSRYWGFVPERNLVGRGSAIWMHKEAGFHLPTFARNGFIP